MLTFLFYAITSGIYVWTVGSIVMKWIWTIIAIADIIWAIIMIYKKSKKKKAEKESKENEMNLEDL